MWRVAYPLAISMGSFTVMQFCDRMFLAWYSRPSIEAALPAGILAFTLLSGFMALAQYAGTFVAQFHGAGDREGCSRATAQGLLLAVATWPLLFALIPVGRAVLRWSAHAPAVQADELVYFTILLAGGVHVSLGAAVGGFFSGRGDTRTPMLANVAGALANVGLDYAMIFGRWGFPRMGIAGAAWATVIAGFVAPAAMLALYFGRRAAAAYATRRTFRYDAALMGRLLRYGLPSAANLLLDVGSFTVFVLLTGRMGSTALAASNIALSVNNLAFMPLMALSIAASILVGQHQGRGDAATAGRAGWTAVRMGLVYMVAIGATFVLLPETYFRLFAERGREAAVADLLPLGRRLLLLMAAWGCFDAVNIILTGALKGAGDTRFVMLYSVALCWGLWLGGEAVLIFALGRGVLAAWTWMAVFIALYAGGLVWRYRRGRWKSIDLLGREPAVVPARPTPDAAIVTE